MKDIHKNSPNLFSFATSELSQDAFLCWLMEWADPSYAFEDSLLHDTSKEFIASIFNSHDLAAVEINSIDIIRQFKKLDILVIINDEYAIMIEDKTFTNDHSNQLQRYKDDIKKFFPHLKQLPVYFKIADQSHYISCETAGYIPYSRESMLKVLQNAIDQECTNAILLDYYRHLEKLDKEIKSYMTKPVTEWNSWSWQGFYKRLQEEGIKGNWGEVSNANGGFWGFWFKQDPNKRHYIQLEEHRLCVKVVAAEGEDRRRLRSESMKEILELSQQKGLPLIKPPRLGNGATMTVAVMDSYIVTEDGTLKLDETVERLKKIDL
ncbi:PD-(D/E)XK nuclease family protein [Actinomycetes bacterium NPDC127524]